MKKYFLLMMVPLFFLGVGQAWAEDYYGQACSGMGYGTQIPASGICFQKGNCSSSRRIAPVTSGAFCNLGQPEGECCAMIDIVPPPGSGCLEIQGANCKSLNCNSDEDVVPGRQCPVNGQPAQKCCVKKSGGGGGGGGGGVKTSADCVALSPPGICEEPPGPNRGTNKGACTDIPGTFCYQEKNPDDGGGGGVPGLRIPTSAETGLSDRSVTDILINFTLSLLGIFGILAVIAFVVSGIQYFLAGGESKEAEAVKKQLQYIIYGVIVALAGVIIVNAIDAILNGIF